MEVTCPNCDSRFNLPEEAVRPGVKLRCSVCQNVFSINLPEAKPNDDLPTNTDDDDFGDFGADDDEGMDFGSPAEDEKTKSKKGKIIALVVILLVLCAAGGGGAWWYFSEDPSTDSPESVAELGENIKLLTLRGVRQYYLQNEKVGGIFAIEGVVVNEFTVPKDFIEVEAAIYDKEKNPLIVKKQMAGTVLSRFQLQVLGEEELESNMNNQIEILTKNVNVAPGSEVPFMVLFYNPPANMAEYGIKISGAKAAAPQQ